MSRSRRNRTLVAGLVGLSLLAAACGGDDSADSATGTTTEGSQSTEGGGGAAGGEFIDLGTFVGDPPEHIDPALNSTLDAYQVINALYDGLTDLDTTDPANPVVKPLVAESFEANDDATVWTFKIKEGVTFSDGEAIKPSSFARAWERASDPDFAGDYSYLFNFIKGGEEKLAGTAETLEGVKADDATMTLTVTLAAPYSNFATVAGFQLFFPMPSAVDDLADQGEWENGVMIGNGPYKMEKARTDQEIVLVKSDTWAGDVNGEKWEDRLDKIVFKVSADPDTAYNAFEAGEGLTANVPPGRAKEADENHATTQAVKISGTYHFDINMENPVVGGEKNVLLRQAISQAIDRETINEAVYDGIRQTSTGVTPPGIPGFKEDLCKYCGYDEAAAKKAADDWKAAGNSLAAPIKVQFNAGAGHEDVVAIIVDNLKAVGIDAAATPMPTETYFSELAKGACEVCRAGWYADYPTYDNFMYDLFHSDAAGGGNNYSQFKNAEFDKLVDDAKQTVDADEQGKLFTEAEDILLNEAIAVIPINWYVGDYVYNPDKVANFPQSGLGLVAWEQIALKG